ncbi:MAG: DNA polymerase III subunit delta' [Sneathiella sp.]
MNDELRSDQLEGMSHPRELDTLIGHEAAETTFLDSYNSGRFHHAWLITGVKGVGKASFAYRAAKFLLSTNDDGGGMFGPPETLDSPSKHPALALIQAESHPGLTVLRRRYDPKGKKLFKVIRINDVRALSSFFGLKSSDGGWRVVIVDTVDDMNVSAANAFLKILEEPPAQTIFLLLSHTPAGLLPTIRSRCRMLPLRPLSAKDVQQIVTPHAPEIDQDKLEILTSLAEGSPGKAISLLQAGGLEVFMSILDLFQSYPSFDPTKLHGLADIVAKKDGEGTYRIFCELFPWWLSRLVRAASIGFDQMPLVTGEQKIMEKLIASHRPDFWVDKWEASNYLIGRADSINLDRKQVVLNLFLSTSS